MKTLITGLTGFTGRYLQDALLAQEHEVVGLQADLTDAIALAEEMQRVRPDWVVHLAGLAFVGHGEPNDFYRVHLMGTRNLLAALAECGKQPKCVLLASSANVYGNRAEGAMREDATPNPVNDYAVSKLAMEQMAQLWLDKLPIVIARPFNYTGVGQSLNFLIPKLAENFQRRAPFVELGNLDVEREFNDVRFVVSVYRALLAHGLPGEIYNICTGQHYALRVIIDTLIEMTSHTIDVRVNPAFVRANEVKRLYGDVTKINALLAKSDVAGQVIGIRETLRWMLDVQ